MPAAIPIVGGLVGLGVAAVGGWSLSLGFSIGLLGGSLIQDLFFQPELDFSFDLPDIQKQNMSIPVFESSTGFTYVPNQSGTLSPVPIVFGFARYNPVIIDIIIYGDNQEKAYYILGIGEDGILIEDIFVDNKLLSKLGTYSESSFDQNHSWIKLNPHGTDTFLVPASASGTISVGRSANSSVTLNGPIVRLYGGGSITFITTHIWSADGSYQKWQLKLVNVDDPSVVYTHDFTESFYLDGNPAYADREFTFTGLPANSTWEALIEVSCVNDGKDNNVCPNPEPATNSSLVFNKIIVNDSEISKTYRAPYTSLGLLHLIKPKTLSGSPTISVKAKGFGFYNGKPNPAQAFFDIVTQPPEIGLGLDASIIDSTSFEYVRNKCDQLNYEFNRAYTIPTKIDQILREIQAAGRFFVFYGNNKFYFVFDELTEINRSIDFENEIIDSNIVFGQLETFRRASRVFVSYVDKDLNYSGNRFAIEDPELIEQIGLIETDLNLIGVTNQKQAWDLAWLYLKKIKYCSSYVKFTVGAKTVIDLMLGDIINFFNLPSGHFLENKMFRIMSIDETDIGKYEISCEEVRPEVYDIPNFTPYYVYPLEPQFEYDDTTVSPAPVTNVTINSIEYSPENIYGSSQIELSYETPQTKYFKSVKIYYSKYPDKDFKLAIETAADTAVINIPWRWAPVYIRIVTVYNVAGAIKETDFSNSPIITVKLTGSGNDLPGFGIGLYGLQPWNY